jgi:signal transduction histidine kinase/CheY-like chemotaxis protein
MIFLLILPVGLAMLTLSRLAGMIVASLVTSFLIFSPSSILSLDHTVKSITILGIWVVVGLIWLTLRPLLRAVHWAWDGYEHSNELLEQARDLQVDHFQTMEDLKSANNRLTRLNQYTQTLRQIAEEERQTKEQFVTNVSHELRTPLNMIIGFIELITDDPKLYGKGIPIPLLADLQVILRNSQHLSSLIDDVLDLSQIDAGKTSLVKERVSLSEIIHASIIAVRPLYESKNLYLEVEIPSDIPLVLCDRTRIREVILNLLSNAGRFTEVGGVIVQVIRNNNQIIIAVKDTGPGITEENQEKLFRPFQQLDGSIRRHYGGTGLGLSISKRFIELHDGKMWVESTPGKGSSFFFTLYIDSPLPPDRTALSLQNPYQPYELLRIHRPFQEAPIKPRVIVVEEGGQIQHLLNRYMGEVEIIPINNLELAIKELESVPAQALLLNAVRVDDTLQRLKENIQLPEGVPAIIFSMPEIGGEFKEQGLIDYLVKPITRDALLGAIDHLKSKVKTILIVDDEPEILQLFRRMLTTSRKGFRILRASSGKQALEVLQTQKPDLILLDLVMPEMDGFQLLKIIKTDKVLQSIPVLLISARDLSGYPIVSDSLTVTCRDGLSVPKVLALIESLSAVITKADRSHGLRLKATQTG